MKHCTLQECLVFTTSIILAIVAQGSIVNVTQCLDPSCHNRITNYHVLFQIQAEVSSGSTGVGGKLQVRVSDMNKYTLFLNLLWHNLSYYFTSIIIFDPPSRSPGVDSWWLGAF